MEKDDFLKLVGEFAKAYRQVTKPGPVPADIEKTTPPFEVWDYDRFRGHLITIGGSRNPRQFDDFPRIIKLSEDFHSILDDARNYSLNQRGSRFHIMTVNPAKNNLRVLPPAEGDMLEASEALDKKLQEEKQKGSSIVGCIMSEPTDIDFLFRSMGSIIERSRIQYARFSPGRLYELALRRAPLLMGFYTAGLENLLAFRSEETRKLNVEIDPLVVSPAVFVNQWFQKTGFDVSRTSVPGQADVFNIRQKMLGPSLLDVNLKIAEHHKLVLFWGHKGEDLVRIYPE